MTRIIDFAFEFFEGIIKMIIVILNGFITLWNLLLTVTFTYFSDVLRMAVALVKLITTGRAFDGQDFLWSDVFLTIMWAALAIAYTKYVLVPSINWVYTVKPSPKWISPKRTIGFRIVGTYVCLIGVMSVFIAVRGLVDSLIG